MNRWIVLNLMLRVMILMRGYRNNTFDIALEEEEDT